MFPMPNLGGIGDIILIQNLKTGIKYIDIAIILLFLCLLHHNEIYTHTLKFINFVYSMNKQSVNQMTVNLTKGDKHRILYQGHQYAVGYSSINIVIHYPDPIIHVRDYYSDKIDSNKQKTEKDSSRLYTFCFRYWSLTNKLLLFLNLFALRFLNKLT